MLVRNRPRSTLVPWWAVALAAGGVLVGHGLAYALVQPDVHARAGLLASTGHAYLHLLDAPALVLMVVAFAAAVGTGLGRRARPATGGAFFRRLAGLQVATFVAMEVAERLASGASLTGLLDGGLLPVGIAVQLAIAALGAWLLRRLHQMGERLAELLGDTPSRPGRDAVVTLVAGTTIAYDAPELRVAPSRGPPLRRS